MAIYKKLFALILSAFFLISCSDNNSTTRQGYSEGELIFLASSFSGNLRTLSVQRGNQVKVGQFLFDLDEEPEFSELKTAEEKFKQAQATLLDLKKGKRPTEIASLEALSEQAEADLELAKARLARNKRLFTKGAIDKDSLDAAETQYKKEQEILAQREADLANAKLASRVDVITAQEAAVAEAKAQLAKAQWALAQKKLSAPVDAVVYDTFYKVGELVPANNPVVALLAPENIRIIFFVSEPLLSKINLGEEVQLGCDGCEKNYPAKISYISPEAEYTPPVIYSEKNNEKLVYRIKAIPALENASKFHPGQPVYVYLTKAKNK